MKLRLTKPMFFLFICWIASAVPLLSQGGTTQNFGEVGITLLQNEEGESIHGYAEFKFKIENYSPQNSHRVTLICPNRQYSPSREHYIQEIKRTVEVAPLSSISVSMFQPALRISGSDIKVLVDGNSYPDILRTRNIHASYRHDKRGLILISRESRGEFAVATAPHHGTSSAPVHSASPPPVHDASLPPVHGASLPPVVVPFQFPSDYKFIRSNFNVDIWSETWIGYSRYDAVVITKREMENAPENVRSALLRYVECGGILLVLGLWSVPHNWMSRVQAKDDLAIYYAGFGHCITCNVDEIGQLKDAQLKVIHQFLEHILSQWTHIARGDYTASSANRVLPVIASELAVPARGLFILILLFAILIGPVHLYILAKKNKRIWMFWTVPLISGVTCIIIFLYSFLAVGWKTIGTTKTITILDENSHHATTIGWTGFYASITPGKGLHFSTDTEVTPLVEGYPNASIGRSLDWTNGQHLSSGWVTAQVPSHMVVRKNEIRRERLTFQKDESSLKTVVNGLGYRIIKLVVADMSGKVYRGHDIPAGSQNSLYATNETCSGTPESLQISDTFPLILDINQIAKIDAQPNTYLMPGTYIAILDSSPFLEQGLANLQSRTCFSVVYGIMERR